MKTYFFKICCLLYLTASIFTSCKSNKEPVNPSESIKMDFQGEILGYQLSLKLGEDNIINNSSVLFTLPDVFADPSEVQLGATLQNENYYLSLTAPKLKYSVYNFDAVKQLLNVGKKNIGTERLTSDVNDNKDTFVFMFSSKKLFNSNKAFISKGMEGHSLEIIEAKEIPGEAGFEKGIEITAKINCRLYNGDTYEGDLKNGMMTLKYFYAPYRK